ncbi:facilitated trehalose transporter Tret1-like [Amphibalanus amphitrite]|uniref:facilitated trehalose transporter Tret1-like n=1 Tax=Amphibalanus amphitrite TaxID=1232801 RepID=UPI001C91103A|nr:facilitated trehalose transporter Tret1-like [Amphibalanus amphitrite]
MGQQDEIRTQPPGEVQPEVERHGRCSSEEDHYRPPMEEVDMSRSAVEASPLPSRPPAVSTAAVLGYIPSDSSQDTEMNVVVDCVVATNPDIERALHDETHKERFELFISELKLDETPGVPRSPSSQTVVSGRRGKLPIRQVIAALAVSVGSMLVGFTAAYTSPALASMQLPDSRLKITDEQASWIGSLMPLSALCGGLGSGTLIEKLGRKITIMGTGLPFMLSYALIAFAQDVYMIYVARVIAGLCIGTLSLAMPVYLGETIQPDIRGTLGLLPTTIGNTGILVCFLVGTYLRWDHLALFAGCIPVPFLVMMWFVPETPRWYVTHGNMKEAAKSLRWLRGKDVDITDELNSITEHITTAQRTHTSLRDLLSPHYLRALAIALALMFFQQMSGINAVIFYSVSIFKFAGSTIDGNLCSVVVGLVNFGATFIANVMIDRLGRKILLYISSALMVASLAVLGGFFYLKDMTSQTELVAELGWLPLVSFMVFVVAFSVGWGPIPWLFLGEGLPSRIRGSAGSVATAFNWACTFVVTKTFTDMIHSIGAHGTFWVFGACTAVGLLFTIGFMPETRGKTLEDIEKNLFTTKQGSMRKRSSVPAEL